MGRVVGKMHEHDFPKDRETLRKHYKNDDVWQCVCGMQWRASCVGQWPHDDQYFWVYFQGLIDNLS